MADRMTTTTTTTTESKMADETMKVSTGALEPLQRVPRRSSLPESSLASSSSSHAAAAAAGGSVPSSGAGASSEGASAGLGHGGERDAPLRKPRTSSHSRRGSVHDFTPSGTAKRLLAGLVMTPPASPPPASLTPGRAASTKAQVSVRGGPGRMRPLDLSDATTTAMAADSAPDAAAASTTTGSADDDGSGDAPTGDAAVPTSRTARTSSATTASVARRISGATTSATPREPIMGEGAGDVQFEGWLLKLKQKNRFSSDAKWNRRWFQLRDGFLLYFRNQESKEPAGWLRTAQITSVTRVPTDGTIPGAAVTPPYAFKVTLASRVLYMQATSAEEVEQWRSHLLSEVEAQPAVGGPAPGAAVATRGAPVRNPALAKVAQQQHQAPGTTTPPGSPGRLAPGSPLPASSARSRLPALRDGKLPDPPSAADSPLRKGKGQGHRRAFFPADSPVGSHSHGDSSGMEESKGAPATPPRRSAATPEQADAYQAGGLYAEPIIPEDAVWVKCYDADNNAYYYINTTTEQSAWMLPSSDDPDYDRTEWMKCYDYEAVSTFYVNVATSVERYTDVEPHDEPSSEELRAPSEEEEAYGGADTWNESTGWQGVGADGGAWASPESGLLWVEGWDEANFLPYYVNFATGESQWEWPQQDGAQVIQHNSEEHAWYWSWLAGESDDAAHGDVRDENTVPGPGSASAASGASGAEVPFTAGPKKLGDTTSSSSKKLMFGTCFS